MKKVYRLLLPIN